MGFLHSESYARRSWYSTPELPLILIGVWSSTGPVPWFVASVALHPGVLADGLEPGWVCTRETRSVLRH